MTDQCKNCELKGDIKKCLDADCFQHENWYAKEQTKRIEKLEKLVWINAYDGACKWGANDEKAREFADTKLAEI